jgi:ATP/maltotriose-dependent transcriptional regulator MalT
MFRQPDTAVAETRTISGDRESKAMAADEGEAGASARADDQRAGKPGRKESHESYALTTQSAGAASLDRSTLSPRECGILGLIGPGYSNKRVARALGITAETVKSHVKRVFLKLDVNTRAHAVARAQTLGLLGFEFVRLRSPASAGEIDDSSGVGEVEHSESAY